MIWSRSRDSGSPRDLLVVGLGNPGEEYRHTRHNVGADAISVLTERHHARLRPDEKVRAQTAELKIGGQQVVAAVPMTYMNESGNAISALLKRYEITSWDQLVIIHDELDFEVGQLKIKRGGGLAGHNGLKSVTQHTKTQDYIRIRIGVGKPPGGGRGGKSWVLSRVRGTERQDLDIMIEHAADAVEWIVESGVDAAMQRCNSAGFLE